MALTETIDRVGRRRAGLVDMLTERRTLGLSAQELEDLLVAVGDLEDRVGPDRRARLRRGRAALERELARVLADGS